MTARTAARALLLAGGAALAAACGPLATTPAPAAPPAPAVATVPAAAPATALPPTDPAAIGEMWPGYLNGYLPRTAWPDSRALLPPPPAAGTPAFAADLAGLQELGALRATPRGALAVRDADLHFPAAANAFACALGVQVSETATPHLYTLLRRTLVDAAGPTYAAKDHYRRTRPYAALNAPSCTPDEEASLSKDGSYPSGHAAIGWAWALVLTGIAPDRADALLHRGRQYAQSRAICGVHWPSDVEAGMLVGAAAVARLQSDAVFRAQGGLAQQEIEVQRAAGALSTAQRGFNCASDMTPKRQIDR
ncbi:phosphatase PAP2 family protein [uncultured Xylophilus sp.]|uniref:acid phosphatase n=1 Tax=uncultured Xylophilus sp. TaxID=296832 RepID=UPI0025E04CF2|nr:phosphatase PAP2 family protein [uncultured Xylophilus sp.]